MSHDMVSARGTTLQARRPWHARGRELNIIPPEPWTEIALCLQVDPETFYPEKGGSTREAKAICGGCEVRADCLAYALRHSERFGIWGGLSERERRKIEGRGTAPMRALVEAEAEPIACCAVDDCRQPFTTLRGIHTHQRWRHSERRPTVDRRRAS